MAPTVFISSTIEDLKPYREAAAKAARRAGFLAVLSEDFPASQHRRVHELCRERVGKCEVLVVLVGHRYGWVPPPDVNPDEKSITWIECEAALDTGIHVLAFLVDPAFDGLEEWREGNRLLKALQQGQDITALATEVQRNTRKLREFRTRLSEERDRFHRKTFRIPQDLEIEVFAALRDWPGVAAAPPPPVTAADPARYLQLLREETEYIDIRGLKVGSASANRYPIEQVYIPLATVGAGEREQKPARLEEVLRNPRVVVVGDPGSGKTTFLQRVAFALASGNGERVGLKGNPLPIRIRIGELAEHIRARQRQAGAPSLERSPEWLLDFLAARSEESRWGLSREFFQQRLEAGEAVLLLDGLDEAPDERARKSIAALFENAVRAYGKSRFVVTTRPRAYTEDIRLPGFEQAAIAPLDGATIEQSLRRWSLALYPESPEGARRHLEELLRALRERPEILRMAATPLMLTALAVIHWNNRKLPEQRAELYQSIIGWLTEQREKREGRMKPKRCLECLGELALAMQQDPEGRRETVSRRWAAQRLASRFESVSRAEEFLVEEENDSGIIVSRGPNLAYWHPTFREYLAARAIGGKTDEELYKLLLGEERLYRPEWREVVLLAAGVLAGQGFFDRVDGLVRRVLDTLGKRPKLAARARCAGLLGAVVRDLAPLDYRPADPRYRENLEAVMDIFDAGKCEAVPFQDRLDAAEALGQAGDPRLERDNWVLLRDAKLGDFEIGRYPVTVREYLRFVADTGREPLPWEEQLTHPTWPVTAVTWFEAAAYCDWLGVRTGRRIRLPTEAEWERAASGGLRRQYPWGDEEPDPTRANYYHDDAPRQPTPVGLYPCGATPEGILDMAGNVWEWVADWYEVEKYRVIRGGSWNLAPENLRVASRFRAEPDLSYNDLGFRCVREGVRDIKVEVRPPGETPNNPRSGH